MNEDVIVLGGGLCGLIVAHELATQHHRRVTVIEAGDADEPGPAIRRHWPQNAPARWLHRLGGADDWDFQTAPVAMLAGRRLRWPRGKGDGGSSRINAMIWMPPQPEDFDSLVRVGIDLESLRSAADRASKLIRPESPRDLSSASAAFLKHSGEPGMHPFPRFNRDGRRWTSQMLIDELANDTDASRRITRERGHVTRLDIRGGRIVGLTIRANNELRRRIVGDGTDVVLCLGAIGTPTLLLASGVGPGGRVLDVSGVGVNLHDHLIMPVVLRTRFPSPDVSAPTVSEMARWQHVGTGMLAGNIAECGGFSNDRRWQIHVTPTHYLTFPQVRGESAMTIGVNVTSPRSTGRLTIDDQGQPVLDPGYLADDADVESLRHGVGWARQIAARIPGVEAEMIPGQRRTSDRQLDAAIARFSQTLYHPGGTCAMGAVVDDHFRIPGVGNGRVVDASILPRPTWGNPSSTLAAIAIHAANRIADVDDSSA